MVVSSSGSLPPLSPPESVVMPLVVTDVDIIIIIICIIIVKFLLSSLYTCTVYRNGKLSLKFESFSAYFQLNQL